MFRLSALSELTAEIRDKSRSVRAVISDLLSSGASHATAIHQRFCSGDPPAPCCRLCRDVPESFLGWAGPEISSGTTLYAWSGTEMARKALSSPCPICGRFLNWTSNRTRPQIGELLRQRAGFPWSVGPSAARDDLQISLIAAVPGDTRCGAAGIRRSHSVANAAGSITPLRRTAWEDRPWDPPTNDGICEHFTTGCRSLIARR